MSGGDESGSNRMDKIEKQRLLQEQFFPDEISKRSKGDDSSLIKSFKFFDIDDYEMVKDSSNGFEMIDYDV
jgi:hypothetical protein